MRSKLKQYIVHVSCIFTWNHQLCRAEQAGATIEEGLGPSTTHVIVPPSLTREAAAARLGQTPDTFDPPPGVHFVVPDFVTSSLALQRCLNPSE